MEESPQRYPLGDDVSVGGVWVSDADDVLRYASDGMAQIAGVPVEKLVGCKIPDDFSADTMSEFYPLYRRAKESRQPVYYDRIRVVTPQGRDTFQSGWLIPTDLTAGANDGVCCTVRDVTAAVAFEQELVAGRERWRAMAVLSPVGICESDLNGQCVFVNRKWCDLVGLTADEAMGLGWIEAVHANDRAQIESAWMEFTSGGDRFDEEYRFQRDDGDVLWVHGVAGTLLNDNGVSTGYLGVISDISEQRQSASDLKTACDQAEQYLEIADLIAVVLDQHGHVVQANGKARDLLESGGSPLVGADWFERCIPESVRSRVREVHSSFMGRVVEPVEVYENAILLPDGTERMIEWHNSVVRDGDGLGCGTLSLGLDVSEVRRAEKLKIEGEAKDRFLANMSHELRTPLNSVIGFSGILLQGLAGPLTDEQKTQVSMIRTAGGDLLQLVEDLLDVEQVAIGEVRLVNEEFVWADLVRDFAEQIRPQVEQAGLILDVSVSDCDARVSSDSRRVKQVLTNLVSNAIKFTSTGTLTVECECTEDEAIARVRDTGLGIAESELARIFELYHQVPRSDVAKSQGAGLGLPLSRSYARLLGGDLVVESQEGQGSVFTLRIPRTGAEG